MFCREILDSGINLDVLRNAQIFLNTVTDQEQSHKLREFPHQQQSYLHPATQQKLPKAVNLPQVAPDHNLNNYPINAQTQYMHPKNPLPMTWAGQ